MSVDVIVVGKTRRWIGFGYTRLNIKNSVKDLPGSCISGLIKPVQSGLNIRLATFGLGVTLTSLPPPMYVHPMRIIPFRSILSSIHVCT